MPNSMPRKSLSEGGSAPPDARTTTGPASKLTAASGRGAEPSKSNTGEVAHESTHMPYSALEQLKEKLKVKKQSGNNTSGHREASDDGEAQAEKPSGIQASELSTEVGNNLAKPVVKKQQANLNESSNHGAVQRQPTVTGGDGGLSKNAVKKAKTVKSLAEFAESAVTMLTSARPAKTKSLQYLRPEASGGAKKPATEPPNFGIKPLSELRNIGTGSGGGSRDSPVQADIPPTTTGNVDITVGSGSTAVQQNMTKKRKSENEAAQLIVEKQSSKRVRLSGSSRPSNTPSFTEQDDVTTLIKQKLLSHTDLRKESDSKSNHYDFAAPAPTTTTIIEKGPDRSFDATSTNNNNRCNDNNKLEVKPPISPIGLTASSSPHLTPAASPSLPATSHHQAESTQSTPGHANAASFQQANPPLPSKLMPSKATPKHHISPISYVQRPTPSSVGGEPTRTPVSIKQARNPEEEQHTVVGGTNYPKPSLNKYHATPPPSAPIGGDTRPLPTPIREQLSVASESTLRDQDRHALPSQTMSLPLRTQLQNVGKSSSINTSQPSPPTPLVAANDPLLSSNYSQTATPPLLVEPMPEMTTQAAFEEIRKVDAEIARLHKQVRALEIELNMNFET